MPTTSPPADRAAEVERYVRLFAIELVLDSIEGLDDELQLIPGTPSQDLLGRALSGPLFDSLWPGDDEPVGEDFRQADTRALVVAAELLARIAANPAYFAEKAAYFSQLAAYYLGDQPRAEED